MRQSTKRVRKPRQTPAPVPRPSGAVVPLMGMRLEPPTQSRPPSLPAPASFASTFCQSTGAPPLMTDPSYWAFRSPFGYSGPSTPMYYNPTVQFPPGAFAHGPWYFPAPRSGFEAWAMPQFYGAAIPPCIPQPPTGPSAEPTFGSRQF